MKTGIIQQHNTGNVEENIERLCAGIHRCAAEGAQLVVLPELHNSLYFCQTEDERQFGLAETVPGPSTRRFGRLAAQTGVVLTLSLFERRAAGVYHNTAVVIERDGSIAGCYRKMHIPDDPGYYEKYYFAPGDTGFRPIATSVGRLGVMVCWDQWFPEAARLMALRGADVLICPTAIGWDMHDTEGERTRQRDAWQTVQRGHAIANGLPYVAVNRVGPELDPSFQSQGIMFWGSSFAAGPQGEWLCEMSSREGEEAVVDIDMRRTGEVRRAWPFLRDRRIDAYGGMDRRYIDDPCT